MIEILRTNDLVLISFVEAILKAEGVPCVVADQHGANVEGGVIAIQRRVLVPRDREAHARTVVAQARAEAEGAALDAAEPEVESSARDFTRPARERG